MTLNPAGLARVDLRALLEMSTGWKVYLAGDEPPSSVPAYVRIAPAGQGDVYEMSGRAYITPRWQVDLYAYAVSDSSVLSAGAAAEEALIDAQWTVRHPRPASGFEGQLDAQKRRWWNWNFDAESIY